MARRGLFSRIQHAWSYYVPAIAKPFVAWLVGISETSVIWDVRTALVAGIARAIFNDPTPVSMLESQKASIVDPNVTESTGVVQDTILAPDNNNLVDVVTKAIAALNESNTPTQSIVGLAPVRGEWLGYQLSTDSNAAPAQNDTVIVFLHGGQFQLSQTIQYENGRNIERTNTSNIFIAFGMLLHVGPWYMSSNSALEA